MMLALLLVVSGILSRLLPHPPNMVALGATALFAGARLPLRIAILVPLLVLGISDWVLDLGSGRPPFSPVRIVCYATFACIALLGRRARAELSPLRLGVFSTSASLLFYFTSNFAIWAWGTLYPHSPTGLVACFVAAIPFFWNSLVADLAGTAVLFGMDRLGKRWSPRLRVSGPATLLVAASLCPSHLTASEVEPDETVIVTSTRLPDEAIPRDEVPAHTTVITRERIEALGVRTIQELLALEAGVVVYDQVGNDVQKTVDLRGFASGSGTAVFLDGARINDPRNNGVALETVPIDAVLRIEITRGSAAALVGGGSEAGVIQIFTRRGGETEGSLSAAGGTHGSSRFSGAVGGGVGSIDFFLSGAIDRTDGFRGNSEGDQKRFAATVGFAPTNTQDLELSLVSSDIDFGNPGALTEDEIATDPDAAPFNQLDRSSDSIRQAALNYRAALPGRWSLAANLFARDRDSESLTTGRSAPLFGGFFLASSGSAYGSTIQVSRTMGTGSTENHVAAGIEWTGGTTDTLGFFTPPTDPGSVDLSSPAAKNATTRTTGAVFVQDTFEPTPRFTLTAGARFDHDRTRYEERIPDPTLDGSRSFDELSLRGGSTFKASERIDLYASYGEAFLPPTAEQLFAFPGFGSNPDLRPQDSRSFEVGMHAAVAEGRLDLALFQIDTTDEIVFDSTPILPDDPFGRNVNAGKTRRVGAEASFRGRVSSNLDAFASLSVIDAEFRNGIDRGMTVPLVPRERYAAGMNARLPAGFSLSADVLYVGAQVLDNDDANAQERLDAYTVTNLRAVWAVREPVAGRKGLSLFVEARNLFDRQYATRGIYAFDFGTFTNAVFLTPAPGRRYLAGVEWKP
jgi:iron complex outermembrane receptor protein